MVCLHVLTVTKLMRLFLPEMRARRSGAIINVASIAGLLPIPYMAVYDPALTGRENMAISSARTFVGDPQITFGAPGRTWPKGP